jgi:hypothetical protein
LKDGLVPTEAQKIFYQSLFELLFGDSELWDRFEAFSKFLENFDAAKWTTALYFMFVLLPDKYMFVNLNQKIQNINIDRVTSE